MLCSCTCTCTGGGAHTGWPSECSAEERYNNPLTLCSVPALVHSTGWGAPTGWPSECSAEERYNIIRFLQLRTCQDPISFFLIFIMIEKRSNWVGLRIRGFQCTIKASTLAGELLPYVALPVPCAHKSPLVPPQHPRWFALLVLTAVTSNNGVARRQILLEESTTYQGEGRKQQHPSFLFSFCGGGVGGGGEGGRERERQRDRQRLIKCTQGKICASLWTLRKYFPQFITKSFPFIFEMHIITLC